MLCRLMPTTVVIVGLCVFIGLWSLSCWRNASNPELQYTTDRVIRYQFELKNTTDQLVEDATFEVFAPLKMTQYQKVVSLDASQPYQSEFDDIQQEKLIFSGLQLPPYGTKQVSITVHVMFNLQGNAGWSWKLQNTLSQEVRLVKSELVLGTIAKVGAGTAGRIEPVNIYSWLVENIRSVDYVAEDRGADYAFRYLRGDCTEFMYAFLAIARGSDIPALGFAGFILGDDRNNLNVANYHNWAEFYNGERWLLADAQRRRFESLQEYYLAFRVLGVDQGFASGNSQRFIAHDSRISVRML